MAYEINASVTVRLPDEPMAQAQVAQTVTTAWRQFLDALQIPDGLASAELRIGPGKEPVVRRRRRRRLHLGGNGGMDAVVQDAMAAADAFQQQAGVS